MGSRVVEKETGRVATSGASQRDLLLGGNFSLRLLFEFQTRER